MRRLAIAIAVALVVLAVLACGKGSPDPVVPPAQTAPSSTPRFDGVYAAQKGESIDLLRFTSTGHVASITTATQAAIETAVRLLIAESERCAKGTYTVKDGVIRFTLKNKTGSLDYAGGVHDDKLGVRWRSDINSVSEEEQFSFVRVVDEDSDAGAKSAAGDEEDADAGPPGPVAADIALIPEGAIWYCFRAPTASRCERKLTACESGRKTAATVRKDGKIGKCTKVAAAFCFTVTQRSAAHGAAACSSTMVDCDTERASLSADSDVSDLVVSTCSKQ